MSEPTPGINVGGARHARTILHLLARVRREGRQLTAAEIGVYRGATSAHLLQHAPDLHLVLVDPWAEVPADSDYRQSGDACAKLSAAEHEENFQLMLAATTPYWNRRQWFRQPSVEAADWWADGHFDLAFIDGAHDYQSVRADIRAWWPKIRPGGILSGHDYSGNRRKTGVVRAVDEFAAATGLALSTGRGRVWWFEKPEAA